MPNNNDVGIIVSRNFLEGLLEYLLTPINFIINKNAFLYTAEGNREFRESLFGYLKISPISAVVARPPAQSNSDPLTNDQPVAMSTALPIDNNFAKIITLHNGRQVLFYLDYDEARDVTILHQILFYNGVKWDIDFEYSGPGNHIRARDDFNKCLNEEYAERLLLSLDDTQRARHHSLVQSARLVIKDQEFDNLELPKPDGGSTSNITLSIESTPPTTDNATMSPDDNMDIE